MNVSDRTEQDFQPEGVKVYIRRHCDQKIVVAALESASENGDERAADILKTNRAEGCTELSDDLGFESYETPHVVSLLAKYALNNSEHRPILRKHLEELIGSIVVTACNEFDKQKP